MCSVGSDAAGVGGAASECRGSSGLSRVGGDAAAGGLVAPPRSTLDESRCLVQLLV